MELKRWRAIARWIGAFARDGRRRTTLLGLGVLVLGVLDAVVYEVRFAVNHKVGPNAIISPWDRASAPPIRPRSALLRPSRPVRMRAVTASTSSGWRRAANRAARRSGRETIQ